MGKSPTPNAGRNGGAIPYRPRPRSSRGASSRDAGSQYPQWAQGHAGNPDPRGDPMAGCKGRWGSSRGWKAEGEEMTPWPQDLPIQFDLKAIRWWPDMVNEMEPILLEALKRLRREKRKHRLFAIYRWVTRPHTWYVNWAYRQSKKKAKK